MFLGDIMKKIVFIFMLTITFLFMGGCKFNNVFDLGEDVYMHDYEMNDFIYVTIDGSKYKMYLEKNKTTEEFIKMLPLELDMQELNGNEKYTYLNKSFSTDPFVPKKINIGDVMLFGDNCLVVFYKSFNTSYSYTKIGHIENMPIFNSDNILIRFDA